MKLERIFGANLLYVFRFLHVLVVSIMYCNVTTLRTFHSSCYNVSPTTTLATVGKKSEGVAYSNHSQARGRRGYRVPFSSEKAINQNYSLFPTTKEMMRLDTILVPVHTEHLSS